MGQLPGRDGGGLLIPSIDRDILHNRVRSSSASITAEIYPLLPHFRPERRASAQVLDQNRLDALKKLEALKQSAVGGHEAVESPADETVQVIRQ